MPASTNLSSRACRTSRNRAVKCSPSRLSDTATTGSFVIAVQLRGGIGNQLFQYAAARALALRLGVPLALDLRLFDNHTARRYALDAFAIETAEIDRNAFPPSARRLSGQIASWFKARSRFSTF